MIVQVRRCCCALTTFVRLVSVFFTVFHLLLALSATIWYFLFSNNFGHSVKRVQDNNEVDDSTFDSFVNGQLNNKLPPSKESQQELFPHFQLVVLIILCSFASVGAIVNVLVMIGIKVKRRSLLIPWLVFHLMVVLGCFAGGIYLALWFTVLKPSSKPQEQVLSVLALFPIVGGIFLIFLWIFVDQLFIQMGVKKKHKNALGETVIDHSNYNGTINGYHQNGKYASLSKSGIEKMNFDAYQLQQRKGGKVHRTKSMSERSLQNQSKPQQTARHHRVQEFSCHLDLDLLQRRKRARSLEAILDQSSSSSYGYNNTSSNDNGPNYWVGNGRPSPRHFRHQERQHQMHQMKRRGTSLDNMLDESSLETASTSVPSYCTMARRQPLRTQAVVASSSDDSSDTNRLNHHTSYRRIYKVNSSNSSFLQPPTRSRSVELLLDDDPMANYTQHEVVTRFDQEEDSTTNSSTVDLDLNMLPLDATTLPAQAIKRKRRRGGPKRGNQYGYNSDTIRSTHSAKSVTIAPQVTEFHYSEDDGGCRRRAEVMERMDNSNVPSREDEPNWLPDPVYPAPPQQQQHVDMGGLDSPSPSPPPPPPPPPISPGRRRPNDVPISPVLSANHTTWLTNLPPIQSRGASRNYYCSATDVRL